MLNLKKQFILVSAFVAILSVSAHATKGTVGGAGGNSEGLKDKLPRGQTTETTTSGIVLQPPQLNDNPSATLIVETAGNIRADLSVTAFKCQVDREDNVVFGSCVRQFLGSTNNAIKVLPGHYLVKASVRKNWSASTMFSDKAIQIHAGEVKKITMKPVIIAATDRLKEVKLGMDFSNQTELKKSLSYTWGVGGFYHQFIPTVQVSCRNLNGTSSEECGYANYLMSQVSKLVTATCNGRENDKNIALGEIHSGVRQHESLYRGGIEVVAAVEQAFKQDRTLGRLCDKKVLSDEIVSSISITQALDQRIHYERTVTTGVERFLFKMTREAVNLKLVRDEKTKLVTWSVEVSEEKSTPANDPNEMIMGTQIQIQKENNAPAAYVFPGTYFVVYDFIGNWDDTSKTLTQVQYGQVVE